MILLQLASLSDAQSRIHAARKRRRFRVVVAGRRFGKTVLLVVTLVLWACEQSRTEFWLVGPTYRQTKNNAWKMLKSMVGPEIRRGKPNESELYVELKNGSTIHLKGADNPDSLRGPKLGGVGLDEYASMKPRVFTEVIRPALSDLRAPGLLAGSPCGFNHFKDAFDRGQDPGFPDWYSWQFTTKDGGQISDEEIAAAAQDQDERTHRQEYYASFETLSGRIYYSFNCANVDKTIEDDKVSPLLIGMDFNVDPMSACLGLEVGRELHIIDELVLPNSNTEEMSQEIANRWGLRPATEYEVSAREWMSQQERDAEPELRPRDIEVCPDPSGRSRKTSAPVGQTYLSILKRHGFYVNSMSSAPLVVDRVNTVNAWLFSAEGKRRLLIHPRCKQVIKSLEGQTWKLDGEGKSTKIEDTSGGLDHMNAALGYLICSHFGVAGQAVTSEEWWV